VVPDGIGSSEEGAVEGGPGYFWFVVPNDCELLISVNGAINSSEQDANEVGAGLARYFEESF
jgi:hypothetical protein